MPPYLWLRFLTGQKLLALHRHHLGTHMRNAGQEVSLQRGVLPLASSEALAAQLLGRLTTSSQAAMHAEMQLACKKRSTTWTRSIAKCSCCGTSNR